MLYAHLDGVPAIDAHGYPYRNDRKPAHRIAPMMRVIWATWPDEQLDPQSRHFCQRNPSEPLTPTHGKEVVVARPSDWASRRRAVSRAATANAETQKSGVPP